jgi:hypothetical protein
MLRLKIKNIGQAEGNIHYFIHQGLAMKTVVVSMKKH